MPADIRGETVIFAVKTIGLINMQEETEYINVYGARVHNLKNIDAEILVTA